MRAAFHFGACNSGARHSLTSPPRRQVPAQTGLFTTRQEAARRIASSNHRLLLQTAVTQRSPANGQNFDINNVHSATYMPFSLKRVALRFA